MHNCHVKDVPASLNMKNVLQLQQQMLDNLLHVSDDVNMFHCGWLVHSSLVTVSS